MADERTVVERFVEDPVQRRLFKQEQAILEVTEFICGQMEAKGISRSELARRLGKTKGYITQLLDGRTNMTVRTIADVCDALGCRFHVAAAARRRARRHTGVVRSRGRRARNRAA